jgi:hypothetical protein
MRGPPHGRYRTCPQIARLALGKFPDVHVRAATVSTTTTTTTTTKTASSCRHASNLDAAPQYVVIISTNGVQASRNAPHRLIWLMDNEAAPKLSPGPTTERHKH